MLDSRKLLLALVVVALAAIPASAQVVIVGPTVSCIAQAAGTPSIRAEGVTELVGDVLIQCFGGVPTAFNENLRQVNIQVFTQPNINITSRILDDGSADNMTEALLFIDEPSTIKQTLCGSTAYPNSNPITALPAQPIISGVCGAHTGSPIGDGIGTYDPDSAITVTTPQTYRGNTYQGRRLGSNSLIWQGIPFDPPGTQTTRTIRITNVRVNASQLGVPSGATQAVFLLVSTSASGVSNPIALPITNPQPQVALAQNSLTFSVEDAQECLQCEDNNEDVADGGTDEDLGDSDCETCQTLRYQELFPTVFRRRNIARPSPEITGTNSPTPTSQDVLNTIYNSESGFYKAAANNARWPLVLASPASVTNTSRVAGTDGGTLGLADHGTRLIARFANIQNGVQIWVEVAGAVRTVQGAEVDDLLQQTGTAVLVNTDPNGAGPFSAVTGTGTFDCDGVTSSYAKVSIIGGTGQAVWEIMDTDTTSIERFEPRIFYAWEANTSNNLPGLGTSTANGNLAPLSTVATASTSASIPRFVDGATNRNFLTINSCRSNLLFPFATNQGGFDTGFAIANTTKDPFGTPLQTGACTVNFYGYVGNSKVCLSYPSPSITGGEHFVWSLSSGGAVTAVAGFQGYVIAQCDFQYAHGFAFISDLGAQKLAQGYLGLVMDEAIDSRTDSRSESLGQ